MLLECPERLLGFFVAGSPLPQLVIFNTGLENEKLCSLYCVLAQVPQAAEKGFSLCSFRR